MHATPRRAPFFLILFVGLLLAVVVPRVFSAPPARVETDRSDNQRFLNELAQAERTHNYRALLTEYDRRVASAPPEDYESYRRRALTRWGARQDRGALDDFARALDIARHHHASKRVLAVLFYGCALIYREQHNVRDEAHELENAAAVDSGFTDALNDLAWIRATNPDASLRNGRQAVDMARLACKTVPGSVKYLDTLAAAYAEDGDTKRAADAERQAIKAASADARTAGQHKDFLADATARVDFYAKGGRYREEPRRSASPANPG